MQQENYCGQIDFQACRAGAFYGFSTTAQNRWYDDDVLNNEYLVTSQYTAFCIKYMYEIALNVFYQYDCYVYDKIMIIVCGF